MPKVAEHGGPLLRSELPPPLAEALERLGASAGDFPLWDRGLLPDSPDRFLVLEQDGTRLAVLHRSSPHEPDLVARGAELADRAAERLKPALAAAVLRPLALGKLAASGLTVALYPYRQPLSQGVRWWLSRSGFVAALLAWLREGVAVTRGAEAVEDYRARLEWLNAQPQLSLVTREFAWRALERLQSGRWRPVHCLDHGDLWRGNLLTNRDGRGRPQGEHPFCVIDWAGAFLDGHGLFDLVRAASSFRLSHAVLAREVGEHCRALGSEPGDAMGHLLASLGALGQRLEHFPAHRYAALVERTRRRLSEV